MSRRVECIRCGICCLGGICEFGEEDFITGYCKFLNTEGDKACCELIKEGNPGPMGYLGTGCIFRIDSELYKLHVKVTCGNLKPVEFIRRLRLVI